MISRSKNSKCRFFRYNVKIHVNNQQITRRNLVRKDRHRGTKTRESSAEECENSFRGHQALEDMSGAVMGKRQVHGYKGTRDIITEKVVFLLLLHRICN